MAIFLALHPMEFIIIIIIFNSSDLLEHLAMLLTSTSKPIYILCILASNFNHGFNTRNKLLIQKLLKQGYLYHNLRKTFSKFYRRYNDLISKFNTGLKYLLRQGLLEPGFNGDLVYKLKKIVGSNNFSAQFL